MISSLTVTCLASHLTAFAVQEYTGSTSTSITVTNTGLLNVTAQAVTSSSAIGSSWAVYIEILMLLMMAAAIYWGYRRDKRDERNYEIIREDKRKLYVGLYLEPFASVGNSRLDNQRLYETMQ